MEFFTHDSSNQKVLRCQEEEYSPIPQTKDAFARFVRKKRKMLCTEEGESVSTRMIADSLGIEYEQFRKIVNKQKPTKKRDCIIAICALLYATSKETNIALACYNDLPRLDDKYKNDAVIIKMLDKNFQRAEEDEEFVLMSIEDINYYLGENGVPDLDIIDHRHARKTISPSYPFPVLKTQVTTKAEELALGDPYDSLESCYSPSRYHIYASMILGVPGKPQYCLSVTDNGVLGMFEQPNADNNYASPFEFFDSPDETGSFRDCFIELQKKVLLERKRMLDTLNDTKNYYQRMSARIISGSIHVFFETFNYKVPELNEYFLMDYSAGQYTLFVFEDSQFMRYYLSPEEYSDLYGGTKEKPKAKYPSLESFQTVDISIASKEIINIHKRAYSEIKTEIDSLITSLKSGKAQICNLEAIFDSPYGALTFINVADKFNCSIDEDYGVITKIGTDRALFDAPNGSQIELSVEDVLDGCSLGLKSIDDIIAFRLLHGSLKLSELL